jgi:uncharacterized protein
VIDERRVIAGIPVRIVTRTTAPRGSVLFYHGFMSSIDQQSNELISLAENHYIAIGVDAVGHGHRRTTDFERRFSRENPNHEENYRQLLKECIEEIPSLIDALLEERLIKLDSIALAGISMGGYICFGACLAEPRIKVLLPILGSPNWDESSADSPHERSSLFSPRAILIQNAGQDTNVAPDHARAFANALKPFYKSCPQRLRYHEFPESSHFMREHDWNELWQNVLSWLDRFIDSPTGS